MVKMKVFVILLLLLAGCVHNDGTLLVQQDINQTTDTNIQGLSNPVLQDLNFDTPSGNARIINLDDNGSLSLCTTYSGQIFCPVEITADAGRTVDISDANRVLVPRYIIGPDFSPGGDTQYYKLPDAAINAIEFDNGATVFGASIFRSGSLSSVNYAGFSGSSVATASGSLSFQTGGGSTVLDFTAPTVRFNSPTNGFRFNTLLRPEADYRISSDTQLYTFFIDVSDTYSQYGRTFFNCNAAGERTTADGNITFCNPEIDINVMSEVQIDTNKLTIRDSSGTYFNCDVDTAGGGYLLCNLPVTP